MEKTAVVVGKAGGGGVVVGERERVGREALGD